ncbi:SUMF1/EgtB/PvdO family nonheme iron enzyme [Ideonella sp. A 288]|uniref:SUMF1/EgtB/PvdO family nonheme iron enzyme n=1 Tax=Ideonella sp. A 288 TaxID=1962181 RepID=UPI001185360E|nr:SUMF1/EgtB/PvdO family nonheme iron enzyme [Ideonella sp. A 288]
MTRPRLRIFLASPSADTLVARMHAAAAVREVNADLRDAELVLYRWDDPDPARRAVMSATHSGQIDVVEQIAHPKDCDLVIGLFGHTMGSTLDDQTTFGQSPAMRPWHCTEWEVSQGLLGHAAGTVKDIWVWRHAQHLPIDPRMTKAQQALISNDSLRVTEFIESLKGRPNYFTDPADLALQLRPLLRNWVRRQLDTVGPTGTSAIATTTEQLTPTQQALLAALLQSPTGGTTPSPLTDEQLQPLLTEPVRGLRGHLLRRHAQWATREGGRLDRRFVNLTLLLDKGLEFDGPRFGPDTGKGDQGRYDDLARLLDENPDVAAWVLVGDPGSGKSTLLQHHELTTALAALAALQPGDQTDAQAARAPEVCFWQRLSEYSSASPPPAQWLAERWAAQHPALPPLDQMHKTVRLRCLLDGLNEIRAPDRDAQVRAVDAWTDWAAQQAAGARLAPLFSVRTLDQSPMASSGFEVRQITVSPWTRDQMQSYCQQVLGEGNGLWPAIAGDPHQLSLCSLPFNLASQCELFRHLQRPAHDRAELLSGLFWLRLRNERAKGTLTAPGLLTVDDFGRLAGDHWRKAPLALPERGCLVPWLDAIAQQMHRSGRAVSLARPLLLGRVQTLHDTAVAAGRPAVGPAVWLAAVHALNLIGEGDVDAHSGEPDLRFTHQLWQEYFAGRGLRGLPQRPAAEWPPLQAPALPDLGETVAKLGVQQPLPGPDPTHWEEAVKLALQFERDPLPWIGLLQGLNLPLAGRAAATVLPALQASPAGVQALAPLRSALLARSRDPATDLRLRIEAAEALGPFGDPRYVTMYGPQGDRCLIPGRAHWVRFAAGTFAIGSDSPEEPDEGPAADIEVAPFEMAFAPVTNAEYACFVEAGGYANEHWWVGEVAQKWRRGELRDEASIEQYAQVFADLRTDFGGTVARFPNLTESAIDAFRTYASWSEQEGLDQLDRWYGAKHCTEPQEWHNPNFSQPLQPVVGICVYEAEAYLRWLAAQTGLPVRLPTEAQWARAAAGATGRGWPWPGDADPDRWQINADPVHLRRTSPVGVFPGGDSDEGLVDLAGNVWEWTSSAFTDSIDADAVSEAASDEGARRAVRGGSWSVHSTFCRASFRSWSTPGGRNNNLGFRVVCCPIHEP